MAAISTVVWPNSTIQGLVQRPNPLDASTDYMFLDHFEERNTATTFDTVWQVPSGAPTTAGQLHQARFVLDGGVAQTLQTVGNVTNIRINFPVIRIRAQMSNVAAAPAWRVGLAEGTGQWGLGMEFSVVSGFRTYQIQAGVTTYTASFAQYPVVDRWYDIAVGAPSIEGVAHTRGTLLYYPTATTVNTETLQMASGFAAGFVEYAFISVNAGAAAGQFLYVDYFSLQQRPRGE